MPRALSLGQDVPVPDTPEQAKAREEAERREAKRAQCPEQSFRAPSRKYGRIAWQEWHRLNDMGIHLHTYFNGAHVTSHVKWADDLAGEICLFKVNEQGEHYVDKRSGGMVAAQEILFGDVAFEVIHKSPSVVCDAC